MKAPVLLSVAGAAIDFEPLFVAARQRRFRLGWLEIERAAVAPPERAALAAAGAFRAVTVGSDATLVIKPRFGAPVLRDLLREHFLGADAVLVRGLDLFPKLRLAGGNWRLAESAERERLLDLDGLFARLRKPELRWRGRSEGATSG